MFALRKFCLVGALALGLGACASLEPEPCTVEWVDWKKERILDEFTDDYRSEIKTLRNLRGTLETGASSPFQMYRLITAGPRLAEMAETFVGRTVPEVKSALDQCGGAPGASVLFTDLMRREGVDEQTLRVVEQFAMLMEVASETSR